MAVTTIKLTSFSQLFFQHNVRFLRTSVFKVSSINTKKEHNVIDEIFPDVEGSPAMIPRDYFKYPKNKRLKKLIQSSSEVIEQVDKTKHVIIECKNKELNHYMNQKYDKLQPVPLASQTWLNKKSNGDYFKINIYPDKEKRESVFWHNEIDSYEGLGLEDDIVEALKKLGFTKPTYIQALGIPQILQNQNSLLAGETGCGKTLAFLLPLVQEILQWRRFTRDRKLNTPLAMVLVPGRELAFQIGDVADQLASELMFDLEVTVGGHTKRLITHPNFRPVDLLVSSTGAARKLTSSGVYNMSMVRHIVLDEADTILDDSFNEEIVRYLRRFPISFGKGRNQPDSLPTFCQLTLASATLPTSIAKILGDIIDPESLVKVETPRLHQVLCNVPQRFFKMRATDKPSKLLEIAKKSAASDTPLIVFSNRSKVCDWISMFLNENGVSCVNLNGDMAVDIRAGRFDQFQRGFVDVISCTDMASRGLDTIRAKHVLNYDFPVYISDYIHRSGRVGRVGHTADCLITNFVAGELDVELVRKIEMAVRTMTVLPNVNANITRLMHYKIMKSSNMM